MNAPLEEISKILSSINLKDGIILTGLSLSWIPLYYGVARPTEKISKRLSNLYKNQFNPEYFQKIEPKI